jgi:urease accessory protein
LPPIATAGAPDALGAADAPAGAAIAARGWRARLELQFQQQRAGTRLTGRRHVGPLLVQKAFHPERGAGRTSPRQVPDAQVPDVADGPCHVVVVHPPGGVAGGDELELHAELEPGSHALLTTPAAGKFYRRGEAGAARVEQRFLVNGGTLEWLPQENIFYPNSAVALRTVVRLSADARFIGWEIGCLGLPARGETLEGGVLRLAFELWREERPVLLERLTLSNPCLAARWGMAGRCALGTALFYPAERPDLELANAALVENCAAMTLACTLVDGVLICRGVAQRADRLKLAFVALWRALRPALLGREAVLPRIWAT